MWPKACTTSAIAVVAAVQFCVASLTSESQNRSQRRTTTRRSPPPCVRDAAPVSIGARYTQHPCAIVFQSWTAQRALDAVYASLAVPQRQPGSNPSRRQSEWSPPRTLLAGSMKDWSAGGWSDRAGAENGSGVIVAVSGWQRAVVSRGRQTNLYLRFLLLVFAGWINRHRQAVIEYL